MEYRKKAGGPAAKCHGQHSVHGIDVLGESIKDAPDWSDVEERGAWRTEHIR